VRPTTRYTCGPAQLGGPPMARSHVVRRWLHVWHSRRRITFAPYARRV
jgi:hypothetical protein